MSGGLTGGQTELDGLQRFATLWWYPPCPCRPFPTIWAWPVWLAGLVAVVGAQATELATLREELAELRQQLSRHSGNSGQATLTSWAGGPAAPRPKKETTTEQPDDRQAVTRLG